MIYVIYGVWFITFFSGFYTLVVAKERWGVWGNIGAVAFWVPGVMLSTLGVVLLLHSIWGEQLGLERKFMLGLVVGIVFNLIFIAVGWRVGLNDRHSVRE